MQFPNKLSKSTFNAKNNLCPKHTYINWNESAFKVTAVISSLVYLSCNYVNTHYAVSIGYISTSELHMDYPPK